jgi:hypothetical protein
MILNTAEGMAAKKHNRRKKRSFEPGGEIESIPSTGKPGIVTKLR